MRVLMNCYVVSFAAVVEDSDNAKTFKSLCHILNQVTHTAFWTVDGTASHYNKSLTSASRTLMCHSGINLWVLRAVRPQPELSLLEKGHSSCGLKQWQCLHTEMQLALFKRITGFAFQALPRNNSGSTTTGSIQYNPLETTPGTTTQQDNHPLGQLPFGDKLAYLSNTKGIPNPEGQELNQFTLSSFTKTVFQSVHTPLE